MHVVCFYLVWKMGSFYIINMKMSALHILSEYGDRFKITLTRKTPKKKTREKYSIQIVVVVVVIVKNEHTHLYSGIMSINILWWCAIENIRGRIANADHKTSDAIQKKRRKTANFFRRLIFYFVFLFVLFLFIHRFWNVYAFHRTVHT